MGYDMGKGLSPEETSTVVAAAAEAAAEAVEESLDESVQSVLGAADAIERLSYDLSLIHIYGSAA